MREHPTRERVRVYLTSGVRIDGQEVVDASPQERADAREAIKMVLRQGSNDGANFWLDTDTGWACIPRASILYVEVVRV